MAPDLDWDTQGRLWPNRDASRFVEVDGICWHVQEAGNGPPVLLLHGTGASTHSWGRLVPVLAPHFTLVAPDLPGHGFTGSPPDPGAFSLPGMASAVAALLRSLGVSPVLVVGHSAGAAVAAWLTLERRIRPAGLVGVAPSLSLPGGLQLPGVLSRFFRSRFMTHLVAGLARDPRRVDGLLESSGSRVPPESRSCYHLLAASPRHSGAALAMMSRWEPSSLPIRLRTLDVPFLLLSGERDRWIPPSALRRLAADIPHARVVELPEAGHLVHEEAPDLVARMVLGFASGVGDGDAHG